MTGEEVEINAALAAAGIVPIETDFGEMICQLAGVPPSHVTAPVIDWSIEQIDELLVRAGIASPSTAPLADDAARRARAAELVGAARKALRGRFLSADLGVSGANFAVAESGSLVLVENEGNIRLSTALPRTHVAIVGIDKLIPRLADLGLFLTLLPVSATGQRQTTYVSLLHRPIGRLEIVLLDNGRTRVLADPRQYDLLSCIRCGACMNVCPVYRQVSGHAYGGVYPGPIGAVLQPHLRGVEWYGALPFASSLCGACSETCPVAIPLHERLLEWRQRLAGAGQIGVAKRAALRAWSWWMDHPRVYRALRPPAWLIDALAQLLPVGWRWSQGREMPRAARESFGQWWSRTHGPSAD
ncbi:MAG: LUD domain-containing protein [Phycisphaerae bacterium]